MTKAVQYDVDRLREILLDESRSKELVDFFVGKALDPEPGDDPRFLEWYKLAIETVALVNSKAIYIAAESPAERIFLASLVLAFLKADPFGLVIHQVMKDADEEIPAYRQHYKQFKEFLEWWKEHKPSKDIDAYLDEQLARGRMAPDEREFLRHFTFHYYHMTMGNSLHLSMQAPFPNVRVAGKSIRTDMYFWNPASDRIRLIVECDGFKYHSSQESFTADRRRDRELQLRGFQVLRFAGTEIYHDPAGVSSELCKHLWALQESVFDGPKQPNEDESNQKD